MVIQTQPSGAATAGQAFSTQPVIEEEDRYGNIEMSDYSTVVTAALASGTGPLEGMTSVSVSGGVASFADLADDTGGDHLACFRERRPASGDIERRHGKPRKSQPAGDPDKTLIHGDGRQALATQPVIEEEDQYGNLETSDNSTVVTASLSSGTGPLEGATSATVAGGLAVFSNLADNKAGSIALAFESGMLLSANSGLIVVSPAAATQLVIRTPQSSTATAGLDFATEPVIEEEDQYGNVETGDNSTLVTASLNSGAGSLGGTSQVAVSGGVAAFIDLRDETAGSLSLLFSSGELLPAVSATTVVKPAPASQLVIQTQASSTATAGQAFATQPVVEEEDQYGNLETSDNSTVVSASLESGVGPLRGTGFASVSGGVAAFSNLADNEAETITLAFKSGNLQIATSGGIAVSAAAPYQLVIQTQPLERGDGRAGVCDSARGRRRGSIRQSRDKRRQHDRDRVAFQRRRPARGDNHGHSLQRVGDVHEPGGRQGGDHLAHVRDRQPGGNERDGGHDRSGCAGRACRERSAAIVRHGRRRIRVHGDSRGCVWERRAGVCRERGRRTGEQPTWGHAWAGRSHCRRSTAWLRSRA